MRRTFPTLLTALLCCACSSQPSQEAPTATPQPAASSGAAVDSSAPPKATPSEAAPDFDALADAAFNPVTGERGGMDQLNALWVAAYSLDRWHVLIEPRLQPDSDPVPVNATIDGKVWIFVFTDEAALQAYATSLGTTDEQGGVVQLSIDPVEGRSWLRGFESSGVHGVRFNQGAHGWFAPLGQLDTIHMFLTKKGLLK